MSQLVMLHLGLGAFHRAHQAVYMHRLMQAGQTDWTLVAGNTRPDMPETLAALVRQAGAYTLETVSPSGQRVYERITSIGRVVEWRSDLAGLIDQGGQAQTRIVSFTVTEAGYGLNAADGLDLENSPQLQADVQAARAGRPGASLYAALTAILRERMRRGAGPVTLLNCDNLRHGGTRARQALLAFMALLDDDALVDWTRANTTSPNAMVDRITPRSTPDVQARVRAATGHDDPAALMAEQYIQWVVEDDFIAGRPAWEQVGVQMVDAVAPYEEAKIRLLNATHSCVAWAGTLRGHTYIHEAVQEPSIRRMACDYVTEDAIPALSRPDHPSPIDLPAYRDTVLARFANAAIRDTNERVAMDGFSKIPGFIVPTVRERLQRGQGIEHVAVLPALFLAFLQRWHGQQLPFAYRDQAMDAALAHSVCTAPDPVDAFCALPALWGDLAGHEQVLSALRRAQDRVMAWQASAPVPH